MSLTLNQLKVEDQEIIRDIIALPDGVATEAQIRIIHARRDYLSSSILKPFVARFRELDLADYPTKVSAKEIAKEVKAEKLDK